MPTEFKFDSMTRAEQFTEMVVDNRITLRAGSDRVEIETTVRNSAKDHRLRVLFPSGANTDSYLADGAFDVIERPIALPADNHIGREIAVETRPQYSWTSVADSARGLAVVSSGLLETAVPDLADRFIALTLFRGIRRTVQTDGQPAGQLLGDLRFRYWLLPVAGTVDRAALCTLGTLLAAGIHVEQLRAEDVAFHKAARTLPPSMAFLSVDGGAVVTSLRKTTAGLELRMFNPDTVAITVKVDAGGRCSTCVPVNFDSLPNGAALPVGNGVVSFPLPSKRIMTLQLSGLAPTGLI